MAHYGPEEWFYADGNLATNQRAAVFGPGDQNTFASIFSDAGLTVPLSNPTTTDAAGLLEFYVADNSGSYWIFVGPVGTGDSIEWSSGGSADNPVLTVNGIAPDGSGDVEITAVDVDAIPVAIADAKGDLLVATGPDTIVRLPVGADTFVLTADSGAADGVSWQAASGGGGIPDTIIDAKGDLIAGSAPDTPVRVGVGTDGQVLRADSGAAPGVSWDTLTAGDVGADVAGAAAAAAAASQPLATINAKGDLYAGTGNDTTTRLPAGTDGQVLSANSAMATGLEWTAAPGGGIPATIFDAKGDIIAATAADTASRFAVGTNGQALRANSATATGLEWDTLTASDVGAVPVSTSDNIVYGTTTAGAPLNREISTIASPDTVGWRTGDNQLRADTVADGDPAADGDDLTNRTYVAGKIAAYQPLATIDAKGDLYAGTGADTTSRLAVGTDGQYLRAASGQATGLEYHTVVASDVGAQPIATIDAKGDLYAGTGADATSRLAVGTDGQYLRAASGQSTGLEYHTVTASDVGAIANSLMDAKGDIIVATANDTPARLGVGTDTFVLTADSAQATGTKWAAATDTAAIPKSLVDAKGDLIVATANDTPARQAVGTNGYVVVADSAQTNGLKWATEKSFSFMPRSTGYISANGVTTARSSKAATANTMFLLPFMLLIDATTSSIAFEITGNVATAVVRLGFYALDPTTLLPTGAAVVDFGTTTADTTSTKTFAAVQALTAGGWALAIVGQTASPTLRHCSGFNPLVASATFPAGTGLGWNNGWAQTGVSGTLPTIGSIVDSDTPMCGIKF